MRGIGSHQSAKMINDEWLTPPDIIQKLGPFDLDPCSPVKRPWDTAKKHYTKVDDGLKQPWKGFVWCNPPYGNMSVPWLAKMKEHNNGILLIFARTETQMIFDHVWDYASAALFIKGRLYFYDTDGNPTKHNSGGPSVLFAFGDTAKHRLMRATIPGKFVFL